MKCFLQTCGNYEVEELEAQNGAKKLLQTTPPFNCECQKRFQKREKNEIRPMEEKGIPILQKKCLKNNSISLFLLRKQKCLLKDLMPTNCRAPGVAIN